jgi:hypothetical protein
VKCRTARLSDREAVRLCELSTFPRRIALSPPRLLVALDL